jgi:FG-GAP-like repeat
MVGIPTTDTTPQPVIGRWVSGAWRKVAVPWKAAGGLTAVAAIPNAAWVVGRTDWPIAGRWDGTAWSNVAVPRPVGQAATLADVAMVAADHVWAVGNSQSAGLVKPLVLEYGPDPAIWVDRSPQIPTGSEGAVTSVVVAPGGIVWIAGWLTSAGQPRPWVMVRSGDRWADVPVAAVVNGRGIVSDITFVSANSGWISGFVERPGDTYRPFLQSWNGAAWSSIPLPWAATDSIALSAVTMGGDGSLAVVGTRLRQDDQRGVQARRKNGSWLVRTEHGDRGSLMTDLAPLTAGSMAVGVIANKAAVLVTCGKWQGGANDVSETNSSARAPATGRVGVKEGQSVEATTADAGSGATSVAAQTIDGLVAIDRTHAAGLDRTMKTYEGVVADFNADTYPDLYVNRHDADIPILFMGGASGTFTQLNTDWILRDRHGCAAADFNRDSSLDLMCVVGANRGTRMNPNELSLGVANGGGTLATEDFGLLDAYGRGRELAVLNLNGDIYPDLYVTNEPERIDALPSSNRLYRNVGGTSFEPVPAAGLDMSMGGDCAIAADIDDDLDDDVLLCVSEPTDGNWSGARLFVNQAGTFTDRTSALGIVPMHDVDMAVADFNGDGSLDLAQLRNNLLRVSAGGPGGFSTIFELPIQQGVDMAVGDVDINNRPDLYVVQRTSGNDDHLMLVNDGDGTSFTSMSIPQPRAGSADSVLAIDYDLNGRTDFVLLNGRYEDGPIKLTAFYGTSEVP